MIYGDFQSVASSFGPALALDEIVSREHRDATRRIIEILTIAIFLTFVLYTTVGSVPVLDGGTSLDEALLPYLPLFEGFLYLFFAILLVLFAVEAFYRSHYFSDLSTSLHEGDGGRPLVSFEAALSLSAASESDVTASFFRSSIGRHILARLGVDREAIQVFLSGARLRVTGSALSVESETDVGFVSLPSLFRSILARDEALRRFFSSRGLSEDEIVGAARFVERLSHRVRVRARWWGKDALGRIPGIGKDWAYGGGWHMAKYAIEIFEHPAYRTFAGEKLFRHEVEVMEGILSRAREANVILVGEDEETLLGVVILLGKMISDGIVFPPLEHKRVLVFDGNRLIAATKTKAAFETELTSMFSDAAAAGNIIVAIPNFAGFLESARSIGSDAASLLDPFLASENLQVIALASADAFHAGLEPDATLMQRFERVMVKNASEFSLLRLLEDTVLALERRHGVLFTYPSLVAAAKSAEQYFSEGNALDRVEDLVSEVAPLVRQSRRALVMKDDILSAVRSKTGIPVGEITAPEAEKLVKLEEILHRRIVGQDEAVRAISNALRRSRSGLANSKRPMGSFLFLGPTGVGKTETTKALAEVFFGSESNIVRVDMSEYKGVDAMDKLIGSFTTKRPGVLSSALRERSYGVLLLDEFEKASREVLDLFLQILDEGFFSDASGKRVSARNLIIIATSNAGADLIWEFMKAGGDFLSRKDEIVDALVQAGTFKPELLNRFDGVILFHPIVDAHLREVARMMLQRLARRLSEKGIELIVTDSLVRYLMGFGSDPKFGARAMNRAVQDKVEQIIADRMIRGEIKPGMRVELSSADLEQQNM